MRSALSVLALVLPPLVLSACQTTGSVPRPVSLALPGQFSEAPRGGAEPQSDRWWLAFQDETLDKLADDGLRGNLDIAQAVARLSAADANITAAGAGGLPALTLGAQHLTERETGEMKTKVGKFETASAGASASWMLDIFGEYRGLTASARAQRNAAAAGADVARLALLSGLVSGYIDLRYYQERSRIAAATLAVRRKTLSLTQAMRAQGTASDLDVSLAEDPVDAVASEVPGYDAAALKASHRIATLTGQPAPALRFLLDADATQPMPAWRGDAGVPADLVRNRPDVRRAESDLAAAMADIGVARARLFPSIKLSGSITPSYVRSPANNGGLTSWSFGPTISLPIFDGGLLRANVSIAIAGAIEKQAAWKSAVLVAVEEVENALTAYNRDQQTVNALQTRVRSATRAVALSKAAYQAGFSSLLDVIETQKSLYNAQANLATARRDLAQHFVALKIAAGYGLSGDGRADVAITTASVSATCETQGLAEGRQAAAIDQPGKTGVKAVCPSQR